MESSNGSSTCCKRKPETTLMQQWPCKKRAKPGLQILCLSGETGFKRKKEVSPTDFSAFGDRLCPLAVDDREFLSTRRKFVGALGSFAKHTSIFAIHRCTFERPSAQARQEIFRKQELSVEEARGNANLRYAWHGTSKKGILGVLAYGFGQPGVPKHGANYGSGVYLAPESKPFISAMYSDADEDGVQHILLCKVIMGEMEQVSEGCKQVCPSSEDYDTGIDNVTDPSRYIVWSTHMNTHILPQFVVSFKSVPSFKCLLMCMKRRDGVSQVQCLSSQHSSISQSRDESFLSQKAAYHEPMEEKVKQSQETSNSTDACKAPKSPWISFSDLFSMMQNSLSPSVMMRLQDLHHEFQVKRLPRMLFVRLIRALAGDDLLQRCIVSRTMGSFTELPPGH